MHDGSRVKDANDRDLPEDCDRFPNHWHAGV